MSEDDVSDAGVVSVERWRVRRDNDWDVAKAWDVVVRKVRRASSSWLIEVDMMSALVP